MRDININDFTYHLPSERIALYPLSQRDQSKLLVYRQGDVSHHSFTSLVDFIPAHASLFFNDTKVIPARLHFTKDTGATIEIFLLNPITPSPLLVEAMQAQNNSSWKCTVGNIKRWTEGTVLHKQIGGTSLEARLTNREEGIVQFTWDTSDSFAEIINSSGEVPLPPYLKRSAEQSDKGRYQTVYAHYEGAVAAPTAGLHFTDDIMQRLKAKGVMIDFVTLHVSAGTFQPVKVQNAADHTMHKEQLVVSRKNIEHILTQSCIIPVGTTSLRTLESLYWYGMKLLQNPEAPFVIAQHDPYGQPNLPTSDEAIRSVLNYMDRHQLDLLLGETSIYIMPGYTFGLCKGLITNFHQPGSTLILLVAALIGDDWKNVYNQALSNDYRFLSYGDSSLLLPNAV